MKNDYDLIDFYDQDFYLCHHWGSKCFEFDKVSAEGSSLSNEIIKLLKINEEDEILDIRCGRGDTITYLYISQKPKMCCGVDYSKASVQISKRKIETLRLQKCFVIRSFAEYLPFQDGAFSKVYSQDVVEHISKEHLSQMLTEVYRILKINGKFVIKTSPNGLILNMPFVKRIISLFGVKPTEEHINLQSAISLRKQLEKTGFEDITVYLEYGGSPLWLLKELFNRMKFAKREKIVQFVERLEQKRLTRYILNLHMVKVFVAPYILSEGTKVIR
jgi:ubiquinone/menaquinone biosynthesis C-methylase UbiE